MQKITTEEKQKLKDLQKLKRKQHATHKRDKGNSVLLIEKQYYINKTNNFMNENKFTRIEKDLTNKCQQQIKQSKLFHNYSITTTACK